MKFSIKQNILMDNLNYVIKGVSNKNLIPILNCIKFSLTKNGLELSSTDNDISIKTFINANSIEMVDTLGEIVISGRYIYDIIKKLPNQIITIEEVVDSKVYITTSNSKFYLNTNLVSEFPNIEFEENKTPIYLNSNIFKTLINQTIFATSTQESRPVLTGLNIKLDNNKLECTATDSYRLSKKSIILDKIYNDVNIIIPSKNIIELNRMLPEDTNVEIHIFNNKIIFNFDNITVMSRLINGTYPDTSKLIPESFEEEISINLNEFYNSIDRASLLTNDADKNTIKLEINESILKLSSNIPEIGNVEEKIELNKSFEKEIKIAFSSKYMMDALKSFECETIKLLYNGELKPIIIKNAEEDTLVQLILPIRTY